MIVPCADHVPTSRQNQKDLYVKSGKRFFDLTLAIVLIIVLSWVFILIYLAYKVMGDRDVLFLQERIGLKEEIFTLRKFRTLREDQSLPLLQRQFPLGSWLRRTSLDELPQLWNILKGEMSFIGPRPLPIAYLPLFSDTQRLRHSVRPGITGWAQVNGRHSISWGSKFEYDLFYVQHISLWFDLRIVLKTICLLLSFKKDISLHEEKFQGNA